MKNPLLALSKKHLLIGSAIVVVAAGGVTAALNNPQHTGADTSPLVQQVNHNTDELANHDARITNTENDVKDLQDKTGTPPSSSNTIIKEVTVPAPSQPVTDTAQAPVPVTVKQSNVGYDVHGNVYCQLMYTDGTNSEVPAPSTGQGVDFKDNCQTFVGQPKS